MKSRICEVGVLAEWRPMPWRLALEGMGVPHRHPSAPTGVAGRAGPLTDPPSCQCSLLNSLHVHFALVIVTRRRLMSRV